MKVLICGDRNWKHKGIIRRVIIQSGATHIIHGCCRGADKIAGEIAEGMRVSVSEYPAQWDKFGRAAGMIRNKAMLDAKPDIVIAFHNDIASSKGTKNMVEQAKKAGVPVRVVSGG